jgi:hypothetical protein
MTTAFSRVFARAGKSATGKLADSIAIAVGDAHSRRRALCTLTPRAERLTLDAPPITQDRSFATVTRKGNLPMKVIDPGRSYELNAGIGLSFLQKDGSRVVRNGTTNEEILEVLIHRVTEAYQTLPCQESIRALYLLREALAAFRTRTARRVDARVEGTLQPHEVAGHAAGAEAAMVARGLEQIDLAPN